MKQKNIFTKLTTAALLSIALAASPAVLAQTKEKPFAYVEQMPAFKGGASEMMKYLASNIQYPSDAKNNGVEGLVVVQFIVEKDGSISEVHTVKKLGHGTDEEAIRVVKSMSGQWTAGRQNGQLVRVNYTMPIRFTLTEAERTATASIANKMPQYKGGQEAMLKTMSSYLKLPDEAKQENVDARVMVRFYVDQEGNVSNIRLDGTKLKKTVGPDSKLDYMDASTFSLQNKAILAWLSEAAVAAVKATSGNWEPALKKGQPAASEVVLPVQFNSSTGGKGVGQTLLAPSMTKYTKNSYAYDEADVKPTLQDGPLNKFLAKNLRYPKNLSFEGDYKTGFVIKPDGSVVGPFMSPDKEISKEDHYLLHEELRKVVKLMDGKWNPGKVDGQAVPVTYNLVIRFVTDDGSKQPADTSGAKPDVVVTRYK
ncbi:TonB family protein [Pontibacter cellulosilyticus]|uniref:TonB family protein n=1 Tax=Pontibacter cellulosilyticus TaxID=1720253 RepID=A0A923SKK4_9BACT|nr:TonB family protein [Pontibacter cellulosilyticus]MBC5995034.1 TonB family protein [Pontibacter cellulosilyticus]